MLLFSLASASVLTMMYSTNNVSTNMHVAYTVLKWLFLCILNYACVVMHSVCCFKVKLTIILIFFFSKFNNNGSK